MKPNRMKAKLLAGQPALGCSVMFPSPQIVEMLGFAGFDWVLLDCEHGSLSLADVEVMAMAADAVGITAIARPRTQFKRRYPKRDGSWRHGRPGAARQHRGRCAPRDIGGEVRFRRGPRVWRRNAPGQLGPRRQDGGLHGGRERSVAGLRAARARGCDPQRRRHPQGRRRRRVLHRAVGPVRSRWGHPRRSGRTRRRQGDRRDATPRSSRRRKSSACRRRRTMSQASSARASATSTRICRELLGARARRRFSRQARG